MRTCNLLRAACFVFRLCFPSNKVKSALERVNNQCLIQEETGPEARGCSRQSHHRLPPQDTPPPPLASFSLISNCPSHLIQTCWEPCRLLVVLANTDLPVVLGRQQASEHSSSWSNPNRLSSPTLKGGSAVFYTTTTGEKLTPSQVSIMFFHLDHMQVDCLYPWTSH